MAYVFLHPEPYDVPSSFLAEIQFCIESKGWIGGFQIYRRYGKFELIVWP